jgi:hypothetical protein
LNNLDRFNTPVVTGNYKTLNDTVKSFGCKNIQFSIFDTVSYGDGAGQEWIIIYPDITSSQPVFKGECRFCVDYWRISERPIYFTLENPTWKDIIIELDNIMKQGDGCGIFLENINVRKDKFGLQYYEFVIGS